MTRRGVVAAELFFTSLRFMFLNRGLSQISRIIKFGTPKRLFKVCLNLLKGNLSCQPPLRVIRVIRVIHDSDTHAKIWTHS